MKKRLTTFVAAVSLLALTGCTPFSFNQGGSQSTVLVTSIALDKTSASMKVGDTLTLHAVFTPSDSTNQNVLWSTSNSSLAKVSSLGVVSAIASGTVTITATSQADKTKTATCSITIGNGQSTETIDSVSINPTSKDLKPGDKVTLSATISPSSVSNKNVAWSTSNSSVATVSTSGVVTAKGNGTCTITATSQADTSKKGTCAITVSDTAKDAFTLLLYICGADLESGDDGSGHYSTSEANQYGSQASDDISEILSVSGQPKDVNIVLQTGGAGAWASKHGISASKLERYHVSNKKLVRDSQLTKASMGKSSTLQSFLTWGIQTYPAEKYGVVLWNHGGAMEGCCYDELYNGDSLTASEVETAVRGALSATGMTGQKLEFIGYDCCLMQVQDIAEINSKYFNYMVASQETESGTGWDYDNWIDDLYNHKPTTTVLQEICDVFIKDNEYDIYGEHSDTASDQTSSVLDLSKMETYKTAFEAMATKLKSCVSSYGKSNFKSLMKKVQSYGNGHYTKAEIDAYKQGGYDMSSYKYDSDIGYYCDLSNGIKRFGTFDVKDFLDKISGVSQFSSMSSEISAVRTALADLVIYNNASYRAGKSNGLCLVYSYESYTDYSYTSSQTNFTNWFSFNSLYGY